ncbi:NADH-quinone oxidoreductase subunit N [Boudabousia liubingyangii]|uniref:NADH-quinone oxidoreductase subunit N n=2 Tax=Boudabousia liubingyangii TaxID=1921764 RepID=A0A1Q5PR15_9ACTO|nr:NADH-quinone oxidoreductase subunit NuoN [Boudabousia liubingyangii]OKL48579.1 NADH-quinone oxidoreductase subunit N [Boudabousia liubingyangii]OKL49875.1 NADH-quinone oxidoreductase subunit N [Boudabousia liubingyangii]
MNWWALSPIIIVLGTGAVQVLLEAFLPEMARRPFQIVTSLLAIIAAFVMATLNFRDLPQQSVPIAGGELLLDWVGTFAVLILLVLGALSVLVFADRSSQLDGAFAAQPADRPGSADEHLSITKQYQRTEIFPLMMFSLGGMMVFVQATSLLTLFVALEVMSLPLYILAASARRARLISQEAGMKYFLLGAFASAFFLMGSALFFLMFGMVNVTAIRADVVIQFAQSKDAGALVLFVLAVLMILVGLLFKVAAVPFHAWTPDVYQGAPSPVTGFMAAGVKVAAFLAIIRVLHSVSIGVFPGMRASLWIIAALTIIYGTVMGLRQTDVKRMLAYSSIAHAGFILTALTGQNGIFSGTVSSILFYLLTYGIATVGAFAIITLVRDRDEQGNITGEATNMTRWNGLAKESPLLAVSMTIFLLSFAGIPLTAGFMGKFWLFSDAVRIGAVPLVILAVLASAATAVFYFRLIRNMFFYERDDRSVVVASEGFALFAIAFSALATVLLGIMPTLVINLLS